MTQNTNTPTNETSEATSSEIMLMPTQLSHDLKSAILVVSVVVNLIMLTTWIAIQVTSEYDTQLASFLFNS